MTFTNPVIKILKQIALTIVSNPAQMPKRTGVATYRTCVLRTNHSSSCRKTIVGIKFYQIRRPTADMVFGNGHQV